MNAEVEDDFVSITEDTIRNKIVHVLTVYPKVSKSMLQVGIGTAVSPKIWHVVLDHLISEGRVQQEQLSLTGPTGREQTYTIIQLNPNYKVTQALKEQAI